MFSIYKALKADTKMAREDILVVRDLWQSASADYANGHLVSDVSLALSGRRRVNFLMARNAAIAATATSAMLAIVSISWMFASISMAWAYSFAIGAAAVVFGLMAGIYWRLALIRRMPIPCLGNANEAEVPTLLLEHRPVGEMPPVHPNRSGLR